MDCGRVEYLEKGWQSGVCAPKCLAATLLVSRMGLAFTIPGPNASNSSQLLLDRFNSPPTLSNGRYRLYTTALCS